MNKRNAAQFNDPFRFLAQFENVETQVSFGMTSLELSLKPIQLLLKRQNYQKGSTKFIHLAGSKGKGSVARFLEAFFFSPFSRVGLFTSPHINTLLERIRFQGKNMALEEFHQEVLALSIEPNDSFSVFELLTAIAFLYFARFRAEWAIIETGLGGRVDATNIITPELCILTEITLEHTKILGKTLEKITAEKLGIMKPSIPFISMVSQPNLQALIAKRAKELAVPLFQLGIDFQVQQIACSRQETQLLCSAANETETFFIPYSSIHQAKNFAVAWFATKVLKQTLLPTKKLLRFSGIEEWSETKPCFLYDVAHELLSLTALLNLVQRAKKDFARIALVFACNQDKSILPLLPKWLAVVELLILTSTENPRSWDPKNALTEFPSWKQETKVKVETSVSKAYLWIKSWSQPEDLIVVAGSFAVVGEFKSCQQKV